MNNKDCFESITDNYVNENDVNQSQEPKAKRAEQIAAPRRSLHADRVAFEQEVKTDWSWEYHCHYFVQLRVTKTDHSCDIQ